MLIEQQSNNVIALNNLAWVAGQLGDPKALGYAERGLKLAPNSAPVLDTAERAARGEGRHGERARHLTRAVALAPGRHDIRLNYAKALLKAGRTDEGRKELQQLQAVSEEFPGKAEIPALLK